MNQTILGVASAFTQELRDAQVGKKTSLPYIRHQYMPASNSQNVPQFQALVIGGSYYTSALVKVDNGKLAISQKITDAQPVFATKEDLFTFILSHVDPNVSLLGINFAFPLTPFFREGRLDGTLGFGTKEHAFTGLIGEVVGEQIEGYIREQTGKEIKVGIANDTICLLLSGLTQFSWNQVAAGIVGTGMNFALFLDEHTLVNLESANFNRFERSPEAIFVDQQSIQPGNSLIEKEVAGAYMHQVFNAGLKLRGINHPSIVATDQVDVVAKSGNTPAARWANELLTRAAGLIAAQVIGLTQFLERDTTFVMEGSVFWKGYSIQEHIDEALKKAHLPYSVSFVRIPDSGILGAAKLVV